MASWLRGLVGKRPPCRERHPARRDERLSPLVDLIGQDGLLRADERFAGLIAHVRDCATCSAELEALRGQRALLAGLGDVDGAAPTDAGFRGIMAALAEERLQAAAPRSRRWLVLTAGTAAVLVVVAFGLQQRRATLARRAADEAIVSGAQAAYRRAEREYGVAVAMLRERVRAQRGADPALEAGARALAEARAQAARLADERRADPEREALLREALRAEVRYYEDALLRSAAAGQP